MRSGVGAGATLGVDPALLGGDSIHDGFPGKFGKLRCQMNISSVHFDEMKT